MFFFLQMDKDDLRIVGLQLVDERRVTLSELSKSILERVGK
jgi:hypothetical protein